MKVMCRQNPDQVQNPIKSTGTLKSHTDPPLSTSKSTDPSTSSTQFSLTSSTSTSSSLQIQIQPMLPPKHILYSFSEISKATRRFQSQKLKNSHAWKCNLRSKTVVLTQQTTNNPTDFQPLLNELCSVHHSGVIKLIGGCAENDHLYLVYEFETGTNLRDCLRGSKLAGFTVLTSWSRRIQIAVDVAKALEYMHHDITLHYVHNRLKSSSIIIAEPDFRAKVAHFASFFLTGELPLKYEMGSDDEISGDFPGMFRRSGSRKISGVLGYMAPEGVISQKSDVFAFGVVLLEILTGNEPVRFVYEKENGVFRKISLVEGLGWVCAEIGRLRTWVDGRLRDSYPLECAKKVVEIARVCVDLDPIKRPTMRWVASELSRVLMKSKKWDQINGGNEGMSSTFEGR